MDFVYFDLSEGTSRGNKKFGLWPSPLKKLEDLPALEKIVKRGKKGKEIERLLL